MSLIPLFFSMNSKVTQREAREGVLLNFVSMYFQQRDGPFLLEGDEK